MSFTAHSRKDTIGRGICRYRNSTTCRLVDGSCQKAGDRKVTQAETSCSSFGWRTWVRSPGRRFFLRRAIGSTHGGLEAAATVKAELRSRMGSTQVGVGLI